MSKQVKQLESGNDQHKRMDGRVKSKMNPTRSPSSPRCPSCPGIPSWPCEPVDPCSPIRPASPIGPYNDRKRLPCTWPQTGIRKKTPLTFGPSNPDGPGFPLEPAGP